MLVIFQMRDLTSIEAIVLAADYDRANELFQEHVRAQGGDPDALLYRELKLHHLEDAAEAPVREALELSREGLVTCDAAGVWAFTTPLGNRQQAVDAGT